ncbi:MAG: hypothetical protein RKP73_16180 [Candidatus Contendobacter sp.]|nr:hypothetical protein [Candidatus Contendobacter sp.]
MVPSKRPSFVGWVLAGAAVGGGVGLALPTFAAPPLGSGVDGGPVQVRPEASPGLPLPPASRWAPAGQATPLAAGNAAPDPDGGSVRAEEPVIGVSPEPIAACPPEAPIRIDATLCVNQATLDTIEAGGQLSYDPATGQAIFTNPAPYDALNGGYAYNAATEPCDPNLDVLLEEAAVAGSQATRGIVNRQMDYPDTDPLIAVKNPQRDGYGGACTVSLITFDIRDLLGFDPTQTLAEIKKLIDAIAALDIDDLVGAACQVFNTILGDVQRQLLADLHQINSLMPYQQLVQAMRIGFIAPLQSFLSLGLTPRATTATVPGVATGSALWVVHLPEVGYVYLARLSDLSVIVVALSATPLAPGDAG